MNNKEKIKELAVRAKRRLDVMSSPKTADDAAGENQDFAFLEPHLYKEIIQEDSKCS